MCILICVLAPVFILTQHGTSNFIEVNINLIQFPSFYSHDSYEFKKKMFFSNIQIVLRFSSTIRTKYYNTRISYNISINTCTYPITPTTSITKPIRNIWKR